MIIDISKLYYSNIYKIDIEKSKRTLRLFIRAAENKIPIAIFSDILRLNLLKQYGGVWVDSTIYLTLDNDYYENLKEKSVTKSIGGLNKNKDLLLIFILATDKS